MDQATRNQSHFRRLRREGDIPEAALRQALSEAEGGAADLLSILSSRGLISPERARSMSVESSRISSSLVNSLARPQSKPMDFPGYEVVEELRRGGMGAIFKATRRADGRPVAIKVLLTEDPSETVVQRFLREAEVISKLQHPNILKVFDFGWRDEGPFLVAEWIDGQDLGDLIESHWSAHQQPVPEGVLRGIFVGLLGAVEACHAGGIIHRDLKPENVVIEGGSGRPVLIDFGVAHRLDIADSTAPSLTRTGQSLGTPAYMAPEQLDHKGDFGEIGPHTDIWGLGAVLFHLATGRAPFEGMASHNVFATLLKQGPPAPREVAPGVKPWLDALCRDCMERDPSRRPSLSELRERLEAGAAWSPPLAPEVTRSRRAWLLAALPAALLLAAVLAFVSVDRSPPLIARLEAPAVTRDSLTISGAFAEDERATLFVAVEGETRAPRRFEVASPFEVSIALPAEEGEHRLRAWGVDAAGNIGPAERLQVQRDTQPPALELAGTETRVWGGRWVLKGRLDEPDCELRALGGRKEAGIGAFEWELELPLGIREVEVIAADAAGNTRSLTLTVESLPQLRVGPEEEYPTLEAAFAAATPGAQIRLGPGRFAGDGELRIPEVTILGAGRAATTLSLREGLRLWGDGLSLAQLSLEPAAGLEAERLKDLTALTLRGEGGRVEGVAIRGAGSGIAVLGPQSEARPWLIEGCEVSGCLRVGLRVTEGGRALARGGVWRGGGALAPEGQAGAPQLLVDGARLELEGCEVTDGRGPGLAVRTGARAVVRRSRLLDHRCAGIAVWQAELEMEASEVSGNGFGGPHYSSSHGLELRGGQAEVRRCAFHRNAIAGVFLHRGASLKWAGCELEENGRMPIHCYPDSEVAPLPGE